MENNTPDYRLSGGTYGADRAKYELDKKRRAEQAASDTEGHSDLNEHDDNHDFLGTSMMPGLEEMITPDWDEQL